MGENARLTGRSAAPQHPGRRQRACFPSRRSAQTGAGRPCSERRRSAMRRAAIKSHTAYMTTLAAGKAAAIGIKTVREIGSKKVKSLQEVHADIK